MAGLASREMSRTAGLCAGRKNPAPHLSPARTMAKKSQMKVWEKVGAPTKKHAKSQSAPAPWRDRQENDTARGARHWSGGIG